MLRFDERQFEMEILDRGHAMAPQYADRLLNGCNVLEFDPSDIAALPESGMGLQILHEVMDAAVYSSEGGVNCLRLTKLLPC
jgi:anti-sigma regulatory factor (Ser/Thr protein kinase)